MKESRWSTARHWLLALLCLELLAVILDLVWGSHGVLHWEERVNARNGALFACGHLEHWAELQYRTFCGGCTATGLLAAPLYRLAGVTVGVWKLVPAALHLGVVGASTLLALRLAGRQAAALVVLLFLGAPGFYREQALTGWGNHAEASLFPLLAALLALSGRCQALLAGLLMGFGTWFAPITAHAFPAMAWLHRRSAARLGVFALGTAVGLLPLAAFLRDRPAGSGETHALWGNLALAPPADLLGLLTTQGVGGGLWSPFEYGDLGGLDLVWWGTLSSLTLLGAVAQARTPGARRGLVLLGLGGLIAAYTVRYDLWQHLPEFPDHPTFNLRYLAPLVPWLFLGAAVAPSLVSRGRLPLLLVCAFLGLSGLGLRVVSWRGSTTGDLSAPIVASAERLDRTVPLGDPPQPNRREQGRPQDLRTALDWIQAHQDPLDACRGIHMAELGRRLGRASDPGPWVDHALVNATTQDSRDLLAEGAARALGTPDDLASRLAAFRDLGPAVGEAWGRAHAHQYRGRHTRELEYVLPPSAVAGVCAARLDHLTRGRTGLRPGWHQEEPGELHGCSPPEG